MYDQIFLAKMPNAYYAKVGASRRLSAHVFFIPSEEIYCFKQHVAGCSLKRVGTLAH